LQLGKEFCLLPRNAQSVIIEYVKYIQNNLNKLKINDKSIAKNQMFPLLLQIRIVLFKTFFLNNLKNKCLKRFFLCVFNTTIFSKGDGGIPVLYNSLVYLVNNEYLNLKLNNYISLKCC